MRFKKSSSLLVCLGFLLGSLGIHAASRSFFTPVLTKASESLLDLSFAESIRNLKASLSDFEKEPSPTLADLHDLPNVYLYLAYLNKNQGQASEANKYLMEAVRLNPSLVPDEMIFPPSLGALCEKAKDQVWRSSQMGSLTVESRPDGADLFVNGEFKGKTPLRLDKYPAGTIYLHAISGGKTTYQQVELKAGESRTISISGGKKKKSN